jgi:hypothetical protein
MSDARISLSIVGIDARIAEERRLAKKHAEEATRLEGLKQLALEMGVPIGDEQTRPEPSDNKDDGAANISLPYRGMGTKLAAIKYLRLVGKPQGATAIANALLAGGKETTAKAFYRTLDNTLADAAKKKNSELIKVGKKWALKEWKIEADATNFVLKMILESTVRGIHPEEIRRVAIYDGFKEVTPNFPDDIIQKLLSAKKITEWEGRYVAAGQH